MIIPLFILLIPTLGILTLSSHQTLKKSSLYCFILVYGFFWSRAPIILGLDSFNYATYFNKIRDGSPLDFFGSGSQYGWPYQLLVKFSTLFTSNYQNLLVFIFITLLSLLYINSRLLLTSKHEIAWLITVLSTESFILIHNASRQGISSTLIFFAFAIWVYNKHILSILIAIIAASIHLTSLPFYISFLILYRIATFKRPFIWFALVLSLILLLTINTEWFLYFMNSLGYQGKYFGRGIGYINNSPMAMKMGFSYIINFLLSISSMLILITSRRNISFNILRGGWPVVFTFCSFYFMCNILGLFLLSNGILFRLYLYSGFAKAFVIIAIFSIIDPKSKLPFITFILTFIILFYCSRMLTTGSSFLPVFN